MDPSAPATYGVLLMTLARKEISQREVARDLGISVGQANKVFRWLEDGGFVERSRATGRGRRGRGSEVYALANPTGLLRAIGLFRPMGRMKLFTTSVDLPKEMLVRYLTKRPVVFCLGSALEHYTRFYRPDEIAFYAPEHGGPESAHEIRKGLAGWKEGITRVACYALPTRTHGRRARELREYQQILDRLLAIGFAIKSHGAYLTTKVQTVVDLFCDGKALAARDLLRELWGIEL